MSLEQIYEGWKNHLLPEKNEKELIEDVSKSRLAICEECEFISTKHTSIRLDVHCTNCGCTLSAKTKCLTCECPLKKWQAVTPNENEPK